MAGRELTVEKIREALRPLFQRPGLQLALVFGSRSAGRAGKGSDLDLAVLADSPIDPVKVTNEVMRLLHFNEIDVVDLRRTSPLLAMEVMRKGEVLFEKEPGTYPQVYSLIFRRYADTRKLREARKSSIQQFLSERGLT